MVEPTLKLTSRAFLHRASYCSVGEQPALHARATTQSQNFQKMVTTSSRIETRSWGHFNFPLHPLPFESRLAVGFQIGDRIAIRRLSTSSSSHSSASGESAHFKTGIPFLDFLIEAFKNNKGLSVLLGALGSAYVYTISSKDRRVNAVEIIETIRRFTQANITDLEFQLTHAESKINRLQEENQRLEEKNDKFKQLKQTAELINALIHLQKITDGIDVTDALNRLKDFKQKEIEHTEKRIAKLENQEAELQRQLGNKSNELEGVNRELIKIKNSLGNLQTKETKQKKVIDQLTKELDGKKNELTQAKGNSQQIQASIASLQSKLDDEKAKEEQRLNDIREIQSQLSEKEGIETALRETISRAEDEEQLTQIQLRELQTNLQPFKQTFESHDQIESMIESLTVFKDNFSKLSTADISAIHRVWNAAHGADRLTVSIPGALCVNALLIIMSNIKEYKNNCNNVNFGLFNLNKNHNLLSYIVPGILISDIEVLNLQHNYLHYYNGVQSVSEIIKKSKTIKLLFLNNNSFDDDDMRIIVESLNNNTVIQQVFVQNNSFDVNKIREKLKLNVKFKIEEKNGQCILTRISQ